MSSFLIMARWRVIHVPSGVKLVRITTTHHFRVPSFLAISCLATVQSTSNISLSTVRPNKPCDTISALCSALSNVLFSCESPGSPKRFALQLKTRRARFTLVVHPVPRPSFCKYNLYLSMLLDSSPHFGCNLAIFLFNMDCHRTRRSRWSNITHCCPDDHIQAGEKFLGNKFTFGQCIHGTLYTHYYVLTI